MSDIYQSKNDSPLIFLYDFDAEEQWKGEGAGGHCQRHQGQYGTAYALTRVRALASCSGTDTRLAEQNNNKTVNWLFKCDNRLLWRGGKGSTPAAKLMLFCFCNITTSLTVALLGSPDEGQQLMNNRRIVIQQCKRVTIHNYNSILSNSCLN